MTDSLRDRIAEAMQRLIVISEFDLTPEDWVPFLADAVIAELGPLVRYWDKDFKELHYCRECGGWGPKDD